MTSVDGGVLMDTNSNACYNCKITILTIIEAAV